MGANSAKILIYYNPQAEELADELDETIKQVVSDCHAWDLPVFLEPMSYSVDANIKKESAEFAEQRADIVVAAAGVPHFIKPDMIKPGAALLDVGITRTDAGLLGDLDPACAEVAGWIAPMPGGTGPMTRAMLLANVVDTAEGNL